MYGFYRSIEPNKNWFQASPLKFRPVGFGF